MPSKPERNQRVRDGLCIRLVVDRETGERRYCKRRSAAGSVYCPSHVGTTPKDEPPPRTPAADTGRAAIDSWRTRALWAIALGIAAWIGPLLVRGAVQTSNPGACIRWYWIESLALAIPGVVLAIQVFGRTTRPRAALAIAAVIVGWAGLLSPIGQFGARLNDPCLASAGAARLVVPASVARDLDADNVRVKAQTMGTATESLRPR